MFIRLHLKIGPNEWEPMYIKADKIIAITQAYQDLGGGAMVICGEDSAWHVKESCLDIITLFRIGGEQVVSVDEIWGE